MQTEYRIDINDEDMKELKQHIISIIQHFRIKLIEKNKLEY